MFLNPVLPETSIAGGQEVLTNPFSCIQWSNQETLALLKIRSQMNHAFIEAQHQSPLWDEISRKMGEIGYYRSAKKCKEKFENMKNDRFFELLEVPDNQYSAPPNSTNEIPTLIAEAEMAIPSTSETSKATWASQEFRTTYTSSKSLSERGSEGSDRKKRRLTNYFEKMMNHVLEKQQEFHKKFMEALEKYEKDRLGREEAWKIQEMARIKKEQELIAQERALVAAKDAAVTALLQKIYGQEIQLPFTPKKGIGGHVNVDGNWTQGSSSRWPKEEVEALVRVRSNFDLHENGPKGGGGTVWEDISFEMKNLGYDRSSKKCKEKWENINKYYRRVKFGNKKRREDSKTCPYYNLLESLYENRSKRLEHESYSSGCQMKPEYILMQMMTQEQHRLQEPQQSLKEHGIHRGQGSNQDDNEVGHHSDY